MLKFICDGNEIARIQPMGVWWRLDLGWRQYHPIHHQILDQAKGVYQVLNLEEGISLVKSYYPKAKLCR